MLSFLAASVAINSWPSPLQSNVIVPVQRGRPTSDGRSIGIYGTIKIATANALAAGNASGASSGTIIIVVARATTARRGTAAIIVDARTLRC